MKPRKCCSFKSVDLSLTQGTLDWLSDFRTGQDVKYTIIIAHCSSRYIVNQWAEENGFISYSRNNPSRGDAWRTEDRAIHHRLLGWIWIHQWAIHQIGEVRFEDQNSRTGCSFSMKWKSQHTYICYRSSTLINKQVDEDEIYILRGEARKMGLYHNILLPVIRTVHFQ